MNWKNYSHLSGSHAFLSASKHYWLNYTDEKLISSYQNFQKVRLGTRYHSLAENLISLAVRLPDTGTTLNSFVNDAIGFRMTPEVVLYYSPNAYGTADAISYHNKLLRIHDLKTGVTPAAMDQNLIYAALFCLDYREVPEEIILRIYQNDEILEHSPSYEEIREVGDKIIAFDRLIDHINEQAIL